MNLLVATVLYIATVYTVEGMVLGIIVRSCGRTFLSNKIIFLTEAKSKTVRYLLMLRTMHTLTDTAANLISSFLESLYANLVERL